MYPVSYVSESASQSTLTAPVLLPPRLLLVLLVVVVDEVVVFVFPRDALG